ncbi:MAG: tRNA (pseudouridine(54)-N(1))-methyltransferase TrmY [Minicystis sp.]
MSDSSPPVAQRRFVVIGQQATASHHFSLLDLPSSSGRLDVLLRCVRAALMYSHGLRADTTLYLVLQGGRGAPRIVRVSGATGRFLRPDERSLALLVQRVLAVEGDSGEAREAGEAGFVERRAGIAVCSEGLAWLVGELGAGAHYVLEEGAPDLRGVAIEGPAPVFYLGDHRGFSEATRAVLAEVGARPVSVGPLSLHTEDALAIVVNELDRRA